MYEWASDYLEQSRYTQYEISNWARSENNASPRNCQHNLQYWRNLPYIGLGAGAHGYIHPVRTVNVLTPAEYIRSFDNTGKFDFPATPATAEMNLIDFQGEVGETMMMGLRLIQEGVSKETFMQRFNTPMETMFGKQIEKCRRNGLLEWKDGEILRLTKKGRLLGNQVFMLFV
jgi:oxygen-independent coproporphyrinogen-3 oxidase